MSATRHRQRAALFVGYWFDTTTGRRLHRVTRGDLREAHRLWLVGRDIREKRAA